MLSIAITSLTSAFTLILNIVLAPFEIMLSFYYLKIALYISLFIFTLSYIMKWLTGHHLVSSEDETIAEQNFLEEKPQVKVVTFKPQKDLYHNKQSYSKYHWRKAELAKRANARYEKSLVKKNEKEKQKYIKDDLAEWREMQKKMKKGKL